MEKLKQPQTEIPQNELIEYAKVLIHTIQYSLKTNISFTDKLAERYLSESDSFAITSGSIPSDGIDFQSRNTQENFNLRIRKTSFNTLFSLSRYEYVENKKTLSEDIRIGLSYPISNSANNDKKPIGATIVSFIYEQNGDIKSTNKNNVDAYKNTVNFVDLLQGNEKTNLPEKQELSNDEKSISANNIIQKTMSILREIKNMPKKDIKENSSKNYFFGYSFEFNKKYFYILRDRESKFSALLLYQTKELHYRMPEDRVEGLSVKIDSAFDKGKPMPSVEIIYHDINNQTFSDTKETLEKINSFLSYLEQ